MKPERKEELRVLAGILLFVLCFIAAIRVSEVRDQRVRANYERCLAEGHKEFTCGLQAPFMEEE